MAQGPPRYSQPPGEPQTTPQSSRLPVVLRVVALWAAALLVISATPALAGVFIFPVGLFAFMSLPQGQHEATFAAGTLLWSGWAIYVALSLWLVATRAPGVRFVIGLVFALLIVLNIGGCAQILTRLKHGF